MHKENIHTFEYKIVDDPDAPFQGWGKILRKLCGEICIVLLNKKKQDKYLADEEYRNKVINFIREKALLHKRENCYSLCISLDRREIQKL